MVNRKQYQKRFLRFIKAVQDTYRGAVVLAIQEQIEQFIKTGKVPEYPIVKVLRQLYEAAGVPNGIYVRQSLKRDLRKGIDNPADRVRWMMNEYYRRNLLNKSTKQITDTTKKQIQQVMEKATQEGWGFKKTASELRKTTDITKQRAELIVRTETMRAANAGAMLGAADLGIAVEKEWISAQDTRTRFIPRDKYDHLHVDGKRTPFTEGFVIPSTERIEVLQYPGDPEGSAGNVCNCRCTVAFVPIKNAQGIPVSIEQVSPVGSSNNEFLQIWRVAIGFGITSSVIQELINQIEQPDAKDVSEQN
jgi:uncharacterized protein with gpF-like domain